PGRSPSSSGGSGRERRAPVQATPHLPASSSSPPVERDSRHLVMRKWAAASRVQATCHVRSVHGDRTVRNLCGRLGKRPDDAGSSTGLFLPRDSDGSGPLQVGGEGAPPAPPILALPAPED